MVPPPQMAQPALIPYFDWMGGRGRGKYCREGGIVSVEMHIGQLEGKNLPVFARQLKCCFFGCCRFNFCCNRDCPKKFLHFKKRCWVIIILKSRKNFSDDFFSRQFFSFFSRFSKKRLFRFSVGWVKPAAAGQFQVSFAHSEPLSRTFFQSQFPKILYFSFSFTIKDLYGHLFTLEKAAMPNHFGYLVLFY